MKNLFLSLLVITSFSVLAENSAYQEAQVAFEEAFNNPDSTVGTLCDHRWVDNSRITMNGNFRLTYRLITTFCQRYRHVITGDITISKKSCPTYESAPEVFPDEWGFLRSYGSQCTLSKNHKASKVVRPLYITNRERRELGLTREQANNLTTSTICTVTKLPISLICKSSADPLVKPNGKHQDVYYTFYKE